MPVNTQHPEYTRLLPKWERCRDVASGQDAVHDAYERYLPKLKGQDASDYKSYVIRAGFYNATWRTIAGLVGMMFRKPPKIEVPEKIEPLMDDIDASGQPFQLLLQRVSEDALKLGRIAILVDFPVAPPGLTQADALRFNLRPTMHTYSAFSLINWKTGRVNNETALIQAVLKESKWVAADEYSGKDEDRWRVLDLEDVPADVNEIDPARVKYRQRVFKMKAEKSKTKFVEFEQEGETVYPTMNGKTLGYIPMVILGVDDVSSEVDDPPLIDLVDLNLSHYRTTADYEHGCHFTALPTLFLAGFTKENPSDKVYIGSEAAIITSNPEAKASFVEFSGAGLEALEKNLNRKEQQMVILGARMLEPQKRAPETAEKDAQNRKGEESLLSSMAQAISLGMTQALKWFTEWAGASPEAVVVEINRKFFPQPMSPGMLSALLAGWQQGAPGLSDQSLFDLLKQGEVVAEDVDLEDEQARIADRQAQIAAEQTKLFGDQSGETVPPPAPPPAPASDGGKAIHIHFPRGKRTVTGPNGQKYVIDEEAA